MTFMLLLFILCAWSVKVVSQELGYVYPLRTAHISHEKFSFPRPFRLKIFSDTEVTITF